MKMANDEAGSEAHIHKIRKVSDVVSKKDVSLLGHVIRASENDPMKQVTFKSNSLRPLTPAN